MHQQPLGNLSKATWQMAAQQAHGVPVGLGTSACASLLSQAELAHLFCMQLVDEVLRDPKRPLQSVEIQHVWSVET